MNPQYWWRKHVSRRWVYRLRFEKFTPDMVPVLDAQTIAGGQAPFLGGNSSSRFVITSPDNINDKRLHMLEIANQYGMYERSLSAYRAQVIGALLQLD